MTALKKILTTAILGQILLASACAKEPAKPNILFIFADDHAYNAVGFAGNEEIKTPHLDKLSESGTIFTRAYNMGAWHGAVCVASRGMLNSGRLLWQVQPVEFKGNPPRQDRVSLWPEYMKDLGYETYFSGKWHTMGEPSKLFDHAGTLRGGMPQDTSEGYNRPLPDQPDPWSPSDPKFGGMWEGGRHWSEALADESVDFLKQAATREKPFFMYLAFNAPHDPRQSPQEYVDMYPSSQLQVPDSYLPEYPYKEPMDSGEVLRDERTAPFPRTQHAVQVHRSEYYALVTHMDAQIGRILEALKESGQAENTIVIYSADHGLAIGAHGLMGKQNMFEHSMRSPLVFAGQGIETGRTVEAPVYIQDLMPTTFELAHAEAPEEIQFRSLKPLLDGAKHSPHKAIYGAYRPDSQRMIIEGTHKLILYPKSSTVLLFDLEKDPNEIHNLSQLPEYETRIKDLYRILRQQQELVGDSLDLDPIYPGLR